MERDITSVHHNKTDDNPPSGIHIASANNHTLPTLSLSLSNAYDTNDIDLIYASSRHRSSLYNDDIYYSSHNYNHSHNNQNHKIYALDTNYDYHNTHMISRESYLRRRPESSSFIHYTDLDIQQPPRSVLYLNALDQIPTVTQLSTEPLHYQKQTATTNQQHQQSTISKNTPSPLRLGHTSNSCDYNTHSQSLLHPPVASGSLDMVETASHHSASAMSNLNDDHTTVHNDNNNTTGDYSPSHEYHTIPHHPPQISSLTVGVLTPATSGGGGGGGPNDSTIQRTSALLAPHTLAALHHANDTIYTTRAYQNDHKTSLQSSSSSTTPLSHTVPRTHSNIDTRLSHNDNLSSSSSSYKQPLKCNNNNNSTHLSSLSSSWQPPTELDIDAGRNSGSSGIGSLLHHKFQQHTYHQNRPSGDIITPLASAEGHNTFQYDTQRQSYHNHHSSHRTHNNSNNNNTNVTNQHSNTGKNDLACSFSNTSSISQPNSNTSHTIRRVLVLQPTEGGGRQISVQTLHTASSSSPSHRNNNTTSPRYPTSPVISSGSDALRDSSGSSFQGIALLHQASSPHHFNTPATVAATQTSSGHANSRNGDGHDDPFSASLSHKRQSHFDSHFSATATSGYHDGHQNRIQSNSSTGRRPQSPPPVASSRGRYTTTSTSHTHIPDTAPSTPGNHHHHPSSSSASSSHAQRSYGAQRSYDPQHSSETPHSSYSNHPPSITRNTHGVTIHHQSSVPHYNYAPPPADLPYISSNPFDREVMSKRQRTSRQGSVDVTYATASESDSLSHSTHHSSIAQRSFAAASRGTHATGGGYSQSGTHHTGNSSSLYHHGTIAGSSRYQASHQPSQQPSQHPHQQKQYYNNTNTNNAQYGHNNNNNNNHTSQQHNMAPPPTDSTSYIFKISDLNTSDVSHIHIPSSNSHVIKGQYSGHHYEVDRSRLPQSHNMFRAAGVVAKEHNIPRPNYPHHGTTTTATRTNNTRSTSPTNPANTNLSSSSSSTILKSSRPVLHPSQHGLHNNLSNDTFSQHYSSMNDPCGSSSNGANNNVHYNSTNRKQHSSSQHPEGSRPSYPSSPHYQPDSSEDLSMASSSSTAQYTEVSAASSAAASRSVTRKKNGQFARVPRSQKRSGASKVQANDHSSHDINNSSSSSLHHSGGTSSSNRPVLNPSVQSSHQLPSVSRPHISTSSGQYSDYPLPPTNAYGAPVSVKILAETFKKGSQPAQQAPLSKSSVQQHPNKTQQQQQQPSQQPSQQPPVLDQRLTQHISQPVLSSSPHQHDHAESTPTLDIQPGNLSPDICLADHNDGSHMYDSDTLIPLGEGADYLSPVPLPGFPHPQHAHHSTIPLPSSSSSSQHYTNAQQQQQQHAGHPATGQNGRQHHGQVTSDNGVPLYRDVPPLDVTPLHSSSAYMSSTPYHSTPSQTPQTSSIQPTQSNHDLLVPPPHLILSQSQQQYHRQHNASLKQSQYELQCLTLEPQNKEQSVVQQPVQSSTSTGPTGPTGPTGEPGIDTMIAELQLPEQQRQSLLQQLRDFVTHQKHQLQQQQQRQNHQQLRPQQSHSYRPQNNDLTSHHPAAPSSSAASRYPHHHVNSPHQHRRDDDSVPSLDIASCMVSSQLEVINYPPSEQDILSVTELGTTPTIMTTTSTYGGTNVITRMTLDSSRGDGDNPVQLTNPHDYRYDNPPHYDHNTTNNGHLLHNQQLHSTRSAKQIGSTSATPTVVSNQTNDSFHRRRKSQQFYVKPHHGVSSPYDQVTHLPSTLLSSVHPSSSPSPHPQQMVSSSAQPASTLTNHVPSTPPVRFSSFAPQQQQQQSHINSNTVTSQQHNTSNHISHHHDGQTQDMFNSADTLSPPSSQLPQQRPQTSTPFHNYPRQHHHQGHEQTHDSSDTTPSSQNANYPHMRKSPHKHSSSHPYQSNSANQTPSHQPTNLLSSSPGADPHSLVPSTSFFSLQPYASDNMLDSPNSDIMLSEGDHLSVSRDKDRMYTRGSTSPDLTTLRYLSPQHHDPNVVDSHHRPIESHPHEQHQHHHSPHQHHHSPQHNPQSHGQDQYYNSGGGHSSNDGVYTQERLSDGASYGDSFSLLRSCEGQSFFTSKPDPLAPSPLVHSQSMGDNHNRNQNTRQ